MSVDRSDGSAGDASYGAVAGTYAAYRKADARIARAVRDALGDVTTVLNVGAGAGNYEPRDVAVTAVEPSSTMRAQRGPERVIAVDAAAESLPFDDDEFDAAMATFSIHQWGDLDAGLKEMRRVTRGPIVLLTCDPLLVTKYWLHEYCPSVLDTEARRYPTIDRISAAIGLPVTISPVPIPFDCTDGFNEAYYGRPEALLDPGARAACSAWSFVDAAEQADFEARLTADLNSGRWDNRYGALRTEPEFRGSLVLVTARA